MTKTVHIISHSHLDREWYMDFEAHRMRVVELFDTVLDLFDHDPEFKFFHVDGHTLPLDDYLEVRPNQRERVQAAITNGKLRVGPYYILQDAFLISEEANVRNALIGSQELEKWGTTGEKVGYFPDTFGLSGQIPQIVKGTGMEFATFGRGVTPTGFNNTVSEGANFQSTFSEMKWQSPSGDEILGILFANWYSNGNEIPTEREAAIEFWDKKLADVEKFAATDHWLMMNGCDHQPVQTDVSAAIRLANELYPDYHFVHSNFTDYFNSIPKDVFDDLSTVKGELRSQETDGWYTLANTASNRVHIKQRSHDLSTRLEQVIEPLSLIAERYDYPYPADKINFAWKLLLQNYPHDSICACSVDEVIRGMESRFDQVEGVINYLEEELCIWLGQFDGPNRPTDAEYFFHVWNTTSVAKSGIATLKLEVARCQFSEARPHDCYRQMETYQLKDWKVIDANGIEYPAVITDLGVEYGYDLPKDAFRVPYMARYLQIEVAIDHQSPLSVKSLYLVPGKLAMEEKTVLANGIENAYLKVEITDEGTLTIVDKVNQRDYNGQCLLEDTGDAGNEYIFKESSGQRIYSLNKVHSVDVKTAGLEQQLEVVYHWLLPQSADKQLDDEQRRVIDITNRTSGRSEQLQLQVIKVVYSLNQFDRVVRVKISGQNDVKDHRIRLMFSLPKESNDHMADSHYELVTRSNQVSEQWKNPTNPQVMRHAVTIYNEEEILYGLTVSTKGIYEYEVTSSEQGTQLGITLLRCTGEMGDWGYFPTPEAQCLHAFEAELALAFWSGDTKRRSSMIEAKQQFVNFVAYAPVNQKNTQPKTKNVQTIYSSLFKKELPKELVVTAIKQSRYQDGAIIRLVNLSDHVIDLSKYLDLDKLVEVNLLEQSIEQNNASMISDHQIRTYKLMNGA